MIHVSAQGARAYLFVYGRFVARSPAVSPLGVLVSLKSYQYHQTRQDSGTFTSSVEAVLGYCD